MNRWFWAHPEEVDETYCEHQRVAFGFSAALLKAGLACFIHGLVPGLCQTTASRTIEELHQKMAARQNHATPSAPPSEWKPLAAR